MADQRRSLQRVLPILTYHSIDASGSPISVAPDEFRRHMEALGEAGWRTLTVTDLLQGLTVGGWPSRTFLLTFDDGYASIEKGLAEVRAYRFAPIVFIVSGYAGFTNQWPGQPSSVPRMTLLDWAALRSLAEEGWTLGAHSRSHARLTELDADHVDREMFGSRRDIEQRCSLGVDMFSYPYGMVTPAVVTAARRHFRAAVGTRLAYVTRRSNPVHLERLDAYYLQGFPVISRLTGVVAAGYFAIRRAARHLRRLTPDIPYAAA